MASKTATTKTTAATKTLVINHFGVEHNIPYTSISELKVGAFKHAVDFVGQVLLITNTGKEYYLFQQVEVTQDEALAVANEFAATLKTTLGWTAAVELAVTALA